MSVFWLRREIVLGFTVSKKDSYLVSSSIERESASTCVYFVRSNTLLLFISLLCIYLLYRTDPQTYRLDRFLKFPDLSGQVGTSSIPSNNADRKNTEHSGKHSFTPYTSLSPYRQMDRIADRGTNTLAARGLEELFFQLCCCVSFFGLVGDRFWCYILTNLEYEFSQPVESVKN